MNQPSDESFDQTNKGWDCDKKTEFEKTLNISLVFF